MLRMAKLTWMIFSAEYTAIPIFEPVLALVLAGDH
jgi:hypothetical protein